MALIKYEEVLFPGFVTNPEEILKSVENLDYRQGDILICVYPKMGAHWNESLSRCLLRNDNNENTVAKYSLLELNPPEFLRDMKSPRVFYTHLGHNRLPPDHLKNRGKIVMVLRNPKDAMVSSYYHFSRAVMIGNKLKWDDYFEEFMAGNVPFGSVFEYLQKWDEALKKNDLDIECFYYEDHKKKPVETLRRLANHIGVTKTDEELASIVEECSLEGLKSKVDPTTVPPALKDINGELVIYRKGEIGDWKNHFSQAQIEHFDNMAKEKLKGLIFTFEYE